VTFLKLCGTILRQLLPKTTVISLRRDASYIFKLRFSKTGYTTAIKTLNHRSNFVRKALKFLICFKKRGYDGG